MSEDKKIQLGKILLKQKMVNKADLETLLREQKTDRERLASKALQKGLVKEEKLLQALSEQNGIPATNLEKVKIDLKILDLIPRDIAEKHVILPLALAEDSIYLAMASPEDARVIDEIEFVSGKKVFPHVALHSQLVSSINKCYSAYHEKKAVYQAPKYKEGDDPIGKVIALGGMESAKPMQEDRKYAGEDIESPLAVDVPDMDLFTPSAPLEDSSIGSLPVPEKTQNNGYKILVVDDEDDIRMLISRVLTGKGYEVVTAARGLEAIQKVQSENPEMIILDAMLPEVHGFDICKKIKGSSKYGHIPVIMISAIYRGWRYAEDLKKSYGVDDFIEKPFKISELLEKVEKLLRESSLDLGTRNEDLSAETERILAQAIEAYRMGNIDDAVDLLKKGIGIDPLAFKLHYHLALLLGKKGLSYQAIRALENALELAPDYFPALKNLAILYQKAGFKFKAIETWERALGHSSDEETRDWIKQHLMSLL